MILWVVFILIEVVGLALIITAAIKESDKLFVYGYAMVIIPAILLAIFNNL